MYMHIVCVLTPVYPYRVRSLACSTTQVSSTCWCGALEMPTSSTGAWTMQTATCCWLPQWRPTSPSSLLVVHLRCARLYNHDCVHVIFSTVVQFWMVLGTNMSPWCDALVLFLTLVLSFSQSKLDNGVVESRMINIQRDNPAKRAISAMARMDSKNHLCGKCFPPATSELQN